jgi:hypothetical protein
MEPFDLEAVYDAEIAPLMSQIIAICQRNRMPMIATFAYRGDERGENDLCTTVLPFDDRTPQTIALAYGVIMRNSSDLEGGA